MASELAGWLALREASDEAARSEGVTSAVITALPAARPLTIVDLGAGTGSNIRYLSKRLAGAQRWTAVDRDDDLMTGVPDGVATRRAELGSIDGSLLAGAHLVTASALLDLVSTEWLERLAAACRESGAAVLFALTYDGRSACTPPDPDDDLILELFNMHQRRNDKGFGRAAGPDAVGHAYQAFAKHGYELVQEASDWSLPASMQALQTELMTGWAQAATEIVPEFAGRIDAWLRRRLDHLRQGRSTIRVGHQDIGGWLPGPRHILREGGVGNDAAASR
ncbi:MAG TPA: class I SAM-dependent methyltransferase [Vicinamibacterales bacterium]